MVSNSVESHRAGPLHSIGQLAEVAVGKIERFPMDSKLVVGFAVAIHNFHRNITITSHKRLLQTTIYTQKFRLLNSFNVISNHKDTHTHGSIESTPFNQNPSPQFSALY